MSDTYMTECWRHGRRWGVTDACCDDAGVFELSSALASLEERVKQLEDSIESMRGGSAVEAGGAPDDYLQDESTAWPKVDGRWVGFGQPTRPKR